MEGTKENEPEPADPVLIALQERFEDALRLGYKSCGAAMMPVWMANFRVELICLQSDVQSLLLLLIQSGAIDLAALGRLRAHQAECLVESLQVANGQMHHSELTGFREHARLDPDYP